MVLELYKCISKMSSSTLTEYHLWFKKRKQCVYEINGNLIIINCQEKKYCINMNSTSVTRIHKGSETIFIDKEQRIELSVDNEVSMGIEDNQSTDVELSIRSNGISVYQKDIRRTI